jgi:hypothetical protein
MEKNEADRNTAFTLALMSCESTSLPMYIIEGLRSPLPGSRHRWQELLRDFNGAWSAGRGPRDCAPPRTAAPPLAAVLGAAATIDALFKRSPFGRPRKKLA